MLVRLIHRTSQGFLGGSLQTARKNASRLPQRASTNFHSPLVVGLPAARQSSLTNFPLVGLQVAMKSTLTNAGVQTTELSNLAASESTSTTTPSEVSRVERSLKALFTYLSKNEASELAQPLVEAILDQVSILGSLLKEKDDKFKKVVEEKDEKFKKVVEEQDEKFKKVVEEQDEKFKERERVIKEKDNRISDLEASKSDLEDKQAYAQSELIAVVSMRPLVENGAHKFSAKSKTTTAAVKHLVESTLLTTNNKLSDHARKWLAELEDANWQELARLEQSVVSELHDLYHELSKKVHHPHVPIDRGFVCGGTLPFRAAVALVLLELQKQKLMDYQILYTNEKYEPRKRIADGVVSNYTT